MPGNVSLTRGDLRVDHRPSSIHPQHYDPKVDKYTPLGEQYPVTFMLDSMRQGVPTKSRIYHWYDKPFNPLTGGVDDVYTDTGLSVAHSGAAASGAILIVKPAAADVDLMANIRAYNQILFHSTSVHGQVKALVTAVTHSGSFPSFTIQTLETDTNQVLAGTGLTWTVLAKSEDEIHQLGEAVQQHESEYYNYVYTDTEPFSMSEDEMTEYSRIIEDKKSEREMDALVAINLRREFTVLEGVRSRSGDRFYAAGLRNMLALHEPANIVDWRTDITYSSATDTVVGGTIPFFRNLLRFARKWKKVGLKTMLATSATVMDVIDDCVTHSGAGTYKIEEGVNSYGLHVRRLNGLSDSIDIVEDALFEHYPSAQRTGYLIVPDNWKRHQPEDSGIGLPVKKGLRYIPWSMVKSPGGQSGAPVDGENYITRIKGGWAVKETFSFRHLACNMIIDNLGLDKA